MTTDIVDSRPDSVVALAAADAGAAVVRRLYQQPLVHYGKSAIDFATQADFEAEEAIRTVIRGARPADTFVGEEGGEALGQGNARRWLVDPLCGTLNYAAGTPLAAVNVALVRSDDLLAAVSADPISGESFWSDGRVAWVRRAGIDTRLEPTASSKLIDINCDGVGDFVGPQLMADRALRSRYGPRVLSTTLAVAWVAAGRRAGYITDGNLAGSVHFTAGIAICRAAGCVVTDLAGDAIYSGPGLIAAADPSTHHDLLQLVGRYR
ncbi:MAG TPA: inositol monophosphatase [Jatrophihabitans sp.]|nr:inositol monophosphatase [Jatrophihabitans sp.]